MKDIIIITAQSDDFNMRTEELINHQIELYRQLLQYGVLRHEQQLILLQDMYQNFQVMLALCEGNETNEDSQRQDFIFKLCNITPVSCGSLIQVILSTTNIQVIKELLKLLKANTRFLVKQKHTITPTYSQQSIKLLQHAYQNYDFNLYKEVVSVFLDLFSVFEIYCDISSFAQDKNSPSPFRNVVNLKLLTDIETSPLNLVLHHDLCSLLLFFYGEADHVLVNHLDDDIQAVIPLLRRNHDKISHTQLLNQRSIDIYNLCTTINNTLVVALTSTLSLQNLARLYPVLKNEIELFKTSFAPETNLNILQYNYLVTLKLAMACTATILDNPQFPQYNEVLELNALIASLTQGILHIKQEEAKKRFFILEHYYSINKAQGDHNKILNNFRSILQLFLTSTSEEDLAYQSNAIPSIFLDAINHPSNQISSLESILKILNEVKKNTNFISRLSVIIKKIIYELKFIDSCQKFTPSEYEKIKNFSDISKACVLGQLENALERSEGNTQELIECLLTRVECRSFNIDTLERLMSFVINNTQRYSREELYNTISLLLNKYTAPKKSRIEECSLMQLLCLFNNERILAMAYLKFKPTDKEKLNLLKHLTERALLTYIIKSISDSVMLKKFKDSLNSNQQNLKGLIDNRLTTLDAELNIIDSTPPARKKPSPAPHQQTKPNKKQAVQAVIDPAKARKAEIKLKTQRFNQDTNRYVVSLWLTLVDQLGIECPDQQNLSICETKCFVKEWLQVKSAALPGKKFEKYLAYLLDNTVATTLAGIIESTYFTFQGHSEDFTFYQHPREQDLGSNDHAIGLWLTSLYYDYTLQDFEKKLNDMYDLIRHAKQKIYFASTSASPPLVLAEPIPPAAEIVEPHVEAEPLCKTSEIIIEDLQVNDLLTYLSGHLAKKTMLTGGFVRDFFSQQPYYDLDIVTELSTEEVISILAQHNLTAKCSSHIVTNQSSQDLNGVPKTLVTLRLKLPHRELHVDILCNEVLTDLYHRNEVEVDFRCNGLYIEKRGESLVLHEPKNASKLDAEQRRLELINKATLFNPYKITRIIRLMSKGLFLNEEDHRLFQQDIRLRFASLKVAERSRLITELLNKSRFDPLKTTILINLDRDFQSLFQITLPEDFFNEIAGNVLYDDIQRLTFRLLKYLLPKVGLSFASTLFNPAASGSSALIKFDPT